MEAKLSPAAAGEAGPRAWLDIFLETAETAIRRRPAAPPPAPAAPPRAAAAALSGEWPVELVLAHVAANSRLIALAVAGAVSGGSASYRNDAVVDEPYLWSVVDAAGGADVLLADVRRAGDELIALRDRLGERLDAPIHVFIRDGSEVAVDDDWTCGQLVASNFSVHLRLHARQLAEASGRP